jgi:hypothetical protein
VLLLTWGRDKAAGVGGNVSRCVDGVGHTCSLFICKKG